MAAEKMVETLDALFSDPRLVRTIESDFAYIKEGERLKGLEGLRYDLSRASVSISPLEKRGRHGKIRIYRSMVVGVPIYAATGKRGIIRCSEVVARMYFKRAEQNPEYLVRGVPARKLEKLGWLPDVNGESGSISFDETALNSAKSYVALKELEKVLK